MLSKEERKAVMDQIQKKHQNDLLELRRRRYATTERGEVYIHCQDPLCGSDCSLDFEDAEEEPMLFFENITGNFFMSTYSKVLQAEYHTNRCFVENGAVALCDWLSFLGIDYEKVCGEDACRRGWTAESGIFWVDFSHTKKFNIRGEKYYAISPQFDPEELPDEIVDFICGR